MSSEGLTAEVAKKTTVQCFNLKTGTWCLFPPLREARSSAAIVATTGGGAIVVCAGDRGRGDLASCEICTLSDKR